MQFVAGEIRIQYLFSGSTEPADVHHAGASACLDYTSQFETLLGRLDSYAESMMFNQFIWGLQPELARSISLQYPKSIAHAVSLVEMTKLAVKASRRPAMKIGSSNGA